jgi:hypothetical protein
VKALINPTDLINWFEKDKEKAEEIRKNLLWIKDIDEHSNPVIAIARCIE